MEAGQGVEIFYAARLDPQRMVAIFRAYWWLFARVAALILLGAVALTALVPRLYTATADVVLEAPQKPEASGITPPAQPADSATVDTEVQIVQSRRIADQVVTTMGLIQNPRFWAATHRKAPAGKAELHDAAVSVVQHGL